MNGVMSMVRIVNMIPISKVSSRIVASIVRTRLAVASLNAGYSWIQIVNERDSVMLIQLTRTAIEAVIVKLQATLVVIHIYRNDAVTCMYDSEGHSRLLADAWPTRRKVMVC